MTKTARFLLAPGFVFASLAIALIVLMSVGTPEWTCTCDGKDSWKYVGPNGIDQGSQHLDATGHATSCKRTDFSGKVMDRVFGLIFPEHEA